MTITKEAITAVVALVLMVALIISIQQSNLLLEDQSDAAIEADEDRLAAEFQRVVLGCNTEGALHSNDQYLRELCDVHLPTLAKAINRQGLR